MTFYIPKKALLMCASVLKPQQVSATSTYTGNGGTQTITNGLDLAGKGGLTWNKIRSQAASHYLFDTVRGNNVVLATNTTSAEGTGWSTDVSFLNNGVRFDNNTGSNAFNQSGQTYVAWSFRRAKKFFDIVTYTGNGQSGRQIPHGLGDVPGMIAAKSRGAADQGGADGFWFVYHRSLTTPQSGALFLNTTDGRNGTSTWGNTSPTTSTFNVDVQLNYPGRQYVAYLFAHNPDLIDCGSYVGNNGTKNVICGKGWPTQFVMLKRATDTGSWNIHDTARGDAARLMANQSNAESSSISVTSNANGFGFSTISPEYNATGSTYVYLAIRAPT